MKTSVAFDRAADFYDDTRALAPEVSAQLTNAITQAGQLTANSRLLEIGVGTGRVALPIAAQTGAHLTGVDLAVPMLEKLREKQTSERVDVLRGDVTRLPLIDGVFDAVIAAHIFHLVGEPEAALAEVGRVLAPDGVLLFNHGNYDWGVLSAMYRGGSRSSNIGFFRTTDFLTQNGWIAAGEPARFDYTQMTTAAKRIQQMRERIWSSFWQMTDDEIEVRVAEIEAHLIAENHPIDAPVTIRVSHFVSPYRPS